MTYTPNPLPFGSTDDGSVHFCLQLHASTHPVIPDLPTALACAGFSRYMVVLPSHMGGFEAAMRAAFDDLLLLYYLKSTTWAFSDAWKADNVTPKRALPESWFLHTAPLTGNPAYDMANRLRNGNGAKADYLMDPSVVDGSRTLIAGVNTSQYPQGVGIPAILANGWNEFNAQDNASALITAEYATGNDPRPSSQGGTGLFKNYGGYAPDINKRGAFSNGNFLQFSGGTGIGGFVLTVPSAPFGDGCLDSNPWTTNSKLTFLAANGTTVLGTANVLAVSSDHTQATLDTQIPAGFGGSGYCIASPWNPHVNTRRYTYQEFQEWLNAHSIYIGQALGTTGLNTGGGSVIIPAGWGLVGEWNSVDNAFETWFNSETNQPGEGCDSTHSDDGQDHRATDSATKNADAVMEEEAGRPISNGAYDPVQSIPTIAQVLQRGQMLLNQQADGAAVHGLTRMNGTGASLPGGRAFGPGHTPDDYDTWRKLRVAWDLTFARTWLLTDIKKDDNDTLADIITEQVYLLQLGTPIGPNSDTATDHLIGAEGSTPIWRDDSESDATYRLYTNGAILISGSDGVVFYANLDRTYQDALTQTWYGRGVNILPGTVVFLVLGPDELEAATLERGALGDAGMERGNLGAGSLERGGLTAAGLERGNLGVTTEVLT